MSILSKIGNQLSHFIYDYLGEEQFDKLGCQFLDIPCSEECQHPEIYGEPMFISWLWFDYKYKDKTMIELFADSNHGASKADSILINQIANTSRMCLFKVGDCKPGNIELEDLKTGVVYHVREYSMASQIRRNQIMMLRICQENERWIIIMPDGVTIPITIDDPKMLNQIVNNLPDDMTIKDAPMYRHLHQHYVLDDSVQTAEPSEVSLEQAFANSGIDKYLSVKSAKLMMENDFKTFKIDKSSNISLPKAIYTIISLAEFSDQKDVESVVIAVNNYWGSLVSKKHPENIPPDIHFESIDVFPWQEAGPKSAKALQANKVAKSIKIQNELFSNMLKYGLVPVSLYRIIGNAATAHIVNGDLFFGLYLLDRALEICPKYDFGAKKRKEVKKIIKDGEKSCAKEFEELKEHFLKFQIAESPIAEYINWFKSTDIDLSSGDGLDLETITCKIGKRF